ncbi:RDD family protein [Hoeflea poritis]|uniref:RDD family protein n=1 Tax=Hoeflea poritis TaxID=2993659 RepID=A0ABT4VQR6_9HYPH|nr:RDD family protein [Hoeflea poritis]MDA4847047.1 RDD family protein [Hoeflea poritis]
MEDSHDSWKLYSGVRSRRILAFFIDYALVLVLCIPVAILIFFIGVFSFGLGWMLYSVLFAVVALPYVGFTMGGIRQATPGMQIMGVHMVRTDGQLVDPMLAMVHAVLFWIGNVVFIPILLICLFTPRKQLLHDLLLGVYVIRDDI